MADIISSGQTDQALLMADFAAVVAEVNKKAAAFFLSPLTITLGDEFQGVISNVLEAVHIVHYLEEVIVSSQKIFKLRYVIVEGAIDTPINKKIAYGMMGEGLTRARKQIEQLKKSDRRFNFDLEDRDQEKALNNVFLALQSIADSWNPARDYQIVTSFLKSDDYKQVSKELNRTRSVMWKRHKSLNIEAYNALKEVADFIAA